MRDIRFKVIHKEYKKVLGIFTIKELTQLSLFDSRDIDDIAFCQGTELKDNMWTTEHPEGQPIFEGDIVKTTIGIFEIMWNEDNCCFMVWDGFNPTRSIQLTGDNIMDYKITVFGNIHQNKDLYNGK